LKFKPKERWEIALSSIQFQRSFNPYTRDITLPWQKKDLEVKLITRDAMANRVVAYKIPEEAFQSNEIFLTTLNNLLRENFNTLLHVKLINDYLEFNSVKSSQPVLIGCSYQIRLAPELAYLTGFTREVQSGLSTDKYPVINLSEEATFAGHRILDLTRLEPGHVLVYTDVIAPTLMGSQYTQVLKFVPVSKENLVVYESEHLEFKRINCNYLPNIRLWLGGTGGSVVKFKKGDVEVLYNIIFRRVRKRK
jgi:hypothetical protein